MTNTNNQFLDYAYDLNNLIAQSNSNGNFNLESFCLDLDNYVSNNKLTPESAEILDKTINFLYGLVQE